MNICVRVTTIKTLAVKMSLGSIPVNLEGVFQ